MKNLRQLAIDNEAAFIAHVEANFTVNIETEFDTDSRPEDQLDGDTAAAVMSDYQSGNDWAWCLVCVRVSIGGLEASDYLGGCSYANEADFKSGGYYADMLIACLEQIEEDAESVLEKFKTAATV